MKGSNPVTATNGELLAQLTLEEKASLCLGSDFWHTAAISRLAVPAVKLSDGPHGLRCQPDHSDQAALSGSLPATCFPTASALGSSWDPGLVRHVAHAIGLEARAGLAVLGDLAMSGHLAAGAVALAHAEDRMRAT